MKETDQYLEQFERLTGQDRQSSWVYPLRKAGMARFAELGFPTLQQEDWRFTNVAPIAKLPFKPLAKAPAQEVTAETITKLTFGTLPAIRLVFLNGHFVPELSTPAQPVPGVVITNLASALSSDSPVAKAHLAQYARGETNAFVAMNEAFFQDGGFIHVPAGKRVETPVHLLFLSTAKEMGSTAQPRNLIVDSGKDRWLFTVAPTVSIEFDF